MFKFRAYFFVLIFTLALLVPVASVYAQSSSNSSFWCLGGIFCNDSSSNSNSGSATNSGTNPATNSGTNPATNAGGLKNPLTGVNDLTTLLGKILDAVIAIGTVVVTIMLVYCGFLFVIAQGNEEKIRDARSALLWTVIGALVLLGAKVIQGVITATVASLGTS